MEIFMHQEDEEKDLNSFKMSSLSLSLSLYFFFLNLVVIRAKIISDTCSNFSDNILFCPLMRNFTKPLVQYEVYSLIF